MPTDSAIKIIKEFTKSPSRQKTIPFEQVWKAFPVVTRGMLDSTIREVIRREQFDGMDDWSIRYENRQATFTRRTNKVIARVRKAFQSIKKQGASGIYRLHFGSYMREQTCGAVAYVYANSLLEATTIFETMYKPFLESHWWRYATIEFMDFAGKAEALACLGKIEENYKKRTIFCEDEISKLYQEIATTEEKIAKIMALKEASDQLLLMTIED